jgi:molybdopterin-guanine dinucleotide biosynthesis protein A
MSETGITGVVLAGGQGRRMGGEDKGLVDFQGRPLIAWVIDALLPQVDTLIINANRNTERYAELGYPVVPDALGGYQGPLAGFASGMEHARTPLVLTVPCDGPMLPSDLTARLAEGLRAGEAEIAVAHNGERIQPVYALLRTSLLPSLKAFLAGGERKIDRWYASHRTVTVDFSDRPDTFANINSPEDRRALEERENV